ncbi:hypothetical protein WY02_03450 [Pseudonocardia sp. AL041005-10]|nr:hypothetical protein [Pseudonocardia sp. AL041005-10]ALE77659.1 hypothetical protein WY02_03450 [Pseudonocardia sp. AL041005-10]
MTSSTAGRPRPVNDISNREQWWAIGAAFLPGALVLGTALAAGQPLSLPLIGAVMLAILTPIAGAETARRRTVRQAEDVVTPAADPQNDAGEPLRPYTEALLDEAMAERAQRLGWTPPGQPQPQPPRLADGPSGTSALPTRLPDTEWEPGPSPRRAARAADGPPSKQQHDFDYTGARVRAYDEGRAAARGRDPAVRTGRAMADHRDRRTAGRHLRGG